MKLKILNNEWNNKLKEIFGTLKIKKPTQRIMDDIDKGYD